MKLSVCMIVKDEEKSIERILKCTNKFADEIIIVDTGSSDKTKQIAKRYTDKVFDFIWCDDFAVARNYSFSKATMPYIMWLDADDYIDDKNINKIIELKKSLSPADFYMCKYKLGSQFEYYRERIIKNAPHNKWSGFIHEAISPNGKIEYTDIIIEHKKIKASDPKRNLRIYRKHIKDGERLCAREMYYYAKELYYNGYFTTAIKVFKSFLKYNNKYFPKNKIIK